MARTKSSAPSSCRASSTSARAVSSRRRRRTSSRSRGTPMTTNWIAALPADRKKAITAVRALVNRHLPAGFEEHVGASTINWQVPKTVLAETYNGMPYQYVVLASQKNYMALYMCGIYADAKLRTWFEAAFKKSGKKLDMGKAC